MQFINTNFIYFFNCNLPVDKSIVHGNVFFCFNFIMGDFAVDIRDFYGN